MASVSSASETIDGQTIDEQTATAGKHIALFVYDLSGDGVQRRTLTLAHTFAARGHQVDLLVIRPSGPLVHELSPLVKLVTLAPWWERFSKLRWAKKFALHMHDWRNWMLASNIIPLACYLRRERPQALLSTANHTNGAALWAWRLACVQTRLVIRVSNHLSRIAQPTPQRLSLLRLWPARLCYAWADQIIAVSQCVADDLISLTGLPAEQVKTIYNPVISPELYAQAAAPLEHPWFAAGQPPVILGVGRLTEQKDFATLLRAFARICAVREARLIILGEGEERDSLVELSRQLNISAEVALLGCVANPFPYMKHAAVFVLSSAWEGLPSVLIEALAGCPVVSTNCPGGAAEILSNGQYGLLVPVGEDARMAHAILALLTAPPQRQLLTAGTARFATDSAVDQYLEILLGTL